MANQIKFKVGFDVDKAKLNQLKTSLQQIKNLNYKDLMSINNTSASTSKAALKEIKTQAKRVEDALKAAFNPKLGTVNIGSGRDCFQKFIWIVIKSKNSSKRNFYFI